MFKLDNKIGLGLASLGRPGYINIGHDKDLGDDKSKLISGNKITNDGSERFTEEFAKKGEIGLLEGAQVVDKAIEIIKSQN